MNLHEEIAKIAYELYEKSGFIGGRDSENWREAERIVLMRHASQDIEEPEGEEPMSMDKVMSEEVEEKGRRYAGRKIEEKATVIEETLRMSILESAIWQISRTFYTFAVFFVPVSMQDFDSFIQAEELVQ